ncbi:hypothetical protein ACIF80_22930 [Streptomyces sp. NPDC085927]|uniref:hypothetical protein n=1 Tax=Streptomyces sp. NPDC085927 TaxID=3365738 RepID=UPI0037D6AE25
MAILSAIGLASACGEAAKSADEGGKPGASATAGVRADRSKPLTAAELKAALLTEEQIGGFEITGINSRAGAFTEPPAARKETTSPEACRHVREAPQENVLDRGESAAAWSQMYLGNSNFSPRSTLLTSYPVETARTRMTQLRRAIDACDRFGYSNIYGKSSVTTETLSVPDLGEEALRYRTLARLDGKGFHYSLVTAVRVGGVIATVQTSDVLGPLPPDKLAEFKPEPSTDESVIATLIENVIDAESA